MKTQEVEDALRFRAHSWASEVLAAEARVAELEAVRQDLLGKIVGWQDGARADHARIAELEAQNARLRGVLADCHAYLMRRITLLTLNESASDTTQSLARDVSVALDALDDGKAAPL